MRVDGKAQLITANPKTGAHGVEIRERNLNLEAIGRMKRSDQLSATGWQTDVDSLAMTFTLPPGWRLFALFGADHVQGDWLTSWTLLDLFLLLIFSLAVFRLWGVRAGVVAFLAFGLAYHEPGAPRLLWLFLLMPLALLRVVPPGTDRRWLLAWKYLAIVCLVLCLIPFVAGQIQSAIYPQLETPGMSYAARGMFARIGHGFLPQARVAQTMDMEAESARKYLAQGEESAAGLSFQTRFRTSNLLYEPKARIQTGPAEPEWRWNQIRCQWSGPVSANQRIRPVLISLPMHRILTVVRLILLMLLAVILVGVGRVSKTIAKPAAAVLISLVIGFTPDQSQAQIPDQAMLKDLRDRLLQPSDAYPDTAEIPSVDLQVDAGRVKVTSEIHTALQVAVPLPGRLPTWSPVSVNVAGLSDAIVCRRDNYLWVVLPAGVHQVEMEALLPDITEWEWTFLLKPRRVTITAPGWNVTGLRPDGVPEDQVFFSRQQSAVSDGEAAYDRKNFKSIVAVERQLEIGLIWQVQTKVTRLSAADKALSLQIPLLAGESILTSNIAVANGKAEIAIPAGQESFTWESELPVGEDIRLTASQNSRWVERWYLVGSPVWNVALSGLAPVYESAQQNLIPAWHPWPTEFVDLTFSKPEAISGDIVTVQQVRHQTSIGSRQRNTELMLNLECSLGNDFVIELDPQADVLSLKLGGQPIPVRRDGSQLIVPVPPGKQKIDVEWRTSALMETVVSTGDVVLPVEGSNITTAMVVPESRWILWADGPLRGPAVRFWTILACAVLAAWVLGSLSLSPLRRVEWVLLAIGLTQVHVAAALIVVGWLFLVAWRGTKDPNQMRLANFNLLQLVIILATILSMGILVVVVGQGLLGNPDMFIIGNNSSRTYLQWFQPRVGQNLPEPFVVSISVWFYRLAMLFWALWLASALLRWLKWAWTQFNQGTRWRRNPEKNEPPPLQAELVK